MPMSRDDRIRLRFGQWLNWRRFPARAIEFLGWIGKGEPPVRRNYIQLKTYDEFREATPDKVDEYKAYVKEEMAKDVSFDFDTWTWCPESFDFRAEIRKLRVVASSSFPKDGITISDRFLDAVTVDSPYGRRLKFDRCFIRQLWLQDGTNVRLSLVSTYVNELIVDGEALGDLVAEGGAILCPKLGSGERHVCGRFILRGVWFPRASIEGAGESQELRSWRALLQAQNNTLAAGVFRSAELALDRSQESRWSRIFSWWYEVFSDYGNSISRPIGWFVALILAIICVAFVCDGVVIASPNELVGWQKSLSSNKYLRASVYAFQSVFNPLGIFGKPLLIGKTWQFSVITSLLSLACASTLAFAVIGLRRRFKLDG